MSVALAAQSAGTAQPQAAETVFKNIQVLKGIPVDDFMDTMGIMSAALGWDCSECHTGAGTDTVKWEADTDKKRTARRMTLMVAAINRNNFGNRQVVTCWTCHRGRDIPVTMPTIDRVYGEALLEADEIVRRPLRAVRLPTRFSTDISRRSAASSGWRRSPALSRPARAKAFADSEAAERFRFSRRRRISVQQSSSSTQALGGRMPSALSTARADGCRRRWRSFRSTRLEAASSTAPESTRSWPFQRKSRRCSRNSASGLPITSRGARWTSCRETDSRGLVVTLYFDKQTGLLVRMVRFGTSPIGRAPTQVDFADYRDVPGAGIKMPFRWTFGWLNGRDSFAMKDVRVNVPLDAKTFAAPGEIESRKSEK